MGIGEKIRHARQNAGMSQEKLAEAIKVKRATLAAWEIDRNEPDADTIRRIALACNVTTDWLHGMPADYSSMTDDARRLAEKIADLPEHDRQVIEKVLAAMATDAKSAKVTP